MSCFLLEYIDLLSQRRGFLNLRVWYRTHSKIRKHLDRSDKLNMLFGSSNSRFLPSLKDYILRTIKNPQSPDLLSNLLSLHNEKDLMTFAYTLSKRNALENYQLLQRHIGTAAYKKRYKDLSILAHLSVKMVFCLDSLPRQFTLFKYIMTCCDKEPTKQTLLRGVPKEVLSYPSENNNQERECMQRGITALYFRLAHASPGLLPFIINIEDWQDATILEPLLHLPKEQLTEIFTSLLEPYVSMPGEFPVVLANYLKRSFIMASLIMKDLSKI